jgi:hypothetical protein
MMRGISIIGSVIAAALLAPELSACSRSYESETKLIAEKIAVGMGCYPGAGTLAQIDDALRVTKLIGDASEQSSYAGCYRPRMDDELFDQGYALDELALDRAITEAERSRAHLEPELLAKVRKLAMSYGFAPTMDDAEFSQKLHVFRVKVLLGYYGIPSARSADGMVET